MDWIKIKVKHISPDYTCRELGALIKYHALVARLERIPTEGEIKREFFRNEKTYNLLQKKCKLLSFTLQDVANKVLEDVQNVDEKRTYEKERKRKQRAKEVLSHRTGRDSPIVDKIREDKIREDKIRHTKYGELENVKLTPEEYQKLVDLMGEKNVKILILDLDTYIASKGVRYKSHYATIQSWARRKNQEMQNKSKGKRIISA